MYCAWLRRLLACLFTPPLSASLTRDVHLFGRFGSKSNVPRRHAVSLACQRVLSFPIYRSRAVVENIYTVRPQAAASGVVRRRLLLLGSAAARAL